MAILILVGDHDGTGDGENTTNTCPGIGLKFWGRSGSLGGRALPVHKMGRNKRMRQGPQATSIGDVLILSPLDGVRQRSARDNQDWQPPHAHTSQTRQRRVQWAQMAMATLSVRSSVLWRTAGPSKCTRRPPLALDIHSSPASPCAVIESSDMAKTKESSDMVGTTKEAFSRFGNETPRYSPKVYLPN